jgi:hypothetical protein
MPSDNSGCEEMTPEIVVKNSATSCVREDALLLLVVELSTVGTAGSSIAALESSVGFGTASGSICSDMTGVLWAWAGVAVPVTETVDLVLLPNMEATISEQLKS